MAAPARPLFPSGSEEDQVKALYQILRHPARYRLLSADGKSSEMPETVRKLLVQILAGMADGKGVAVIPVTKEMSTKAAANLLGMSRQYLVRLLEEGRIPFHRTGTHRRLLLTDVLDFQKKRDVERHESIRKMALKELEEGTWDKFILPDQE